jgi:hypothetical protein
MVRARSTSTPATVVAFAAIVFAAIAFAACDRNINLGAIGDGGASLLWTATFEPGDLSEWLGDGNGGTYVENVTAYPAATQAMAHRGQYAGISTITPAAGMPSLNYMFREQPSPRQAYYSAWYYIPPSVAVAGWLSLSHFRCSRTNDGNNLFPIWDVNLIPRLDGSVIAHLYNYVTQLNVEQFVPIPVPTGTWVHFEVLLLKAPDMTGHIAVWQDGVLILDNPGVITAQTDWVQWDAGGASNNIAPSPALIYIDDAAISLTRVGPNM